MVRHKNRYFVIKIRAVDSPKEAPLHLHPANVYGAITGAVQQLHGDFGVAATRSDLVAKYCNAATRIGIIRCRHGPHKLIASAMPYVKNIGPYKAYITTLFMGATMRHCFNFIRNYQQRKFEKYCINLKTDEEKAELKKMLLNMDPVLSIL
ncbi:ribonuclease P/MRP protein subunit POP5 [Coccinella septempunctata]|uniref:ribonuclease P/MRP protein subunit POP5 n=1 Tax=Coccinella septempunctata TaxID=41139 RepID=UPI001D073082|nr:ribonuclease P/MRP protein subunit POP5 [Coccinella septempunctata]